MQHVNVKNVFIKLFSLSVMFVIAVEKILKFVKFQIVYTFKSLINREVISSKKLI